MTDKFLKYNYLKIFIGIPIALLFISFALINTKSKVPLHDINPYLNTLPIKYVSSLNNVKKNDSIFFYSIIDNFAIRELVILKSFPNVEESVTNFTIEIYPTNSEEYLSLNIENDAVFFIYQGKTYGIYRKALPIINIDKLIVKEEGIKKKEHDWSAIIESPFELLQEDHQYKKIADERFQFEINPYLPVFVEALKLFNISYLPYSYSQKEKNLFQVNEDLSEFIFKNKKTIGVVKNTNQFWNSINRKSSILSSIIKFNGKESEIANELIKSFITGEKQFDEIFNIKKLADFSALKNVFSKNCNDKVYFLYNSENNLLEPFFMNFDCLGQVLNKVKKTKINDIKYITFYISSLDEISKFDFSEELIKDNEEFREELNYINSVHPYAIFDVDILNLNQRMIKKSLDATSLVTPKILYTSSKKMELTISNLSKFPIEILSLNYNPKKEIAEINSSNLLLGGQNDTIRVDLPRSFENLFVSKKGKKTGFNLYKHIYDLNISYTILGLDKVQYASIIPYQAKEKIEDDLFRIESTVEKTLNIIIDEQNKSVFFTKNEVTISTPLIIPKGYIFIVKPGTKIDIVDGGKIISHAPLNFRGTKVNPIEIFSSDKKGQGIIVLSEGKQSILEHVVFDYLTNPSHGYWSVTGAVTFYESPVKLNYVTVSNNSCEDALNIVRTIFEMKNCSISNTQSDAFDGDFVIGTISTSKFDHLGNDAIDISGSDLKISDVQIFNAGDKGLSAGENSQMAITNVNISTSEIAVAGKDLSTVIIKHLNVSDTKLGFTAFQKKPEFGPSNISVTGLIMKNVEIDYLIENTSSLIVDGVKIETSENVKDRMYGVEFGVSSKETRNAN